MYRKVCDLEDSQDPYEDVFPENADGLSFAKKSLKLNSEDDALDITDAIRACNNLRYLDLEGNTLGPLAAKAIGQALEENGSLLKRALWKDMFTGRSKAEIPKALEYLSNGLCIAGTELTELDLSDNAFGPIGIKGLAKLLTSGPCYTLQVLRLNNNGLGIDGGKMLAKALSDCYDNSLKTRTPMKLKIFVVGRNRLENEGAKALASFYKKLTTLEEVVMPQNGICHSGITAIVEALSANFNLRVLNFNDNTVRHEGAQAIAKALANFKHIEELNLGDCLLKTKGSLILTEALGVKGGYPILTKLDLSFNEIGPEGASPIALAMADKERLEILQLNGNHFGEVGCAVLRDSLTASKRIESLSQLSDDESCEESEKEEEEEEDEDEEDKDEENDEDKEDEEGDDYESENESRENGTDNRDTITNGNVTQLKVSIADFLESPTGEKLLLLQDDTVQDFVNYAMNLSKNIDTANDMEFIEVYTKIIMKVSSLSTSGYVDVRLKAQNLTDALYSTLCSFAEETHQTSVWNNALLVNLGLIKAEDKKNEKIDWNLEGCFKALELATQKDYFLPETRDTIQFFLENPVKINKKKTVDSYQDSKESLKGVLNRIQSAQ